MDEPRSGTAGGVDRHHANARTASEAGPMRGELEAPSTFNRVNISRKQEQREPDISSEEETGGN